MRASDSRIALVGAGEMGRAALGILARRLPDAQFRVFDRSEESLAKAKEIDPARIEPRAGEAESISPSELDVDAVLNFAGPFYVGSDSVARAAIERGCTYTDICDDIEGARAILDLQDAAVAAGVAVITGAGNSPGISNVMAMALLAEHPECDGVRVVWVVQDSNPGGLAPLRHMLHMAVERCPIWDEGQLSSSAGFVPATAREHELPELGRVVAFDTAHPEPITMSRARPELRHVSVQGALLPAWANDAFSTLGRIGFGYHDLTVEVGGQEVAPDEVLWKLLWARHEKRSGGGAEKPGMTCVQTQALKGEDVLASMTVYDDHSMLRTTGLGAAAAALTALESPPPPGAWGTEVLDASRFLAILGELAEAEGALPRGIIANDAG